jgi:hypothetical protein
MTTLSQRLKTGSGEDRELDRDIARFFGWREDVDVISNAPLWQKPDGRWYEKETKTIPPAFCSDLNAVFALVARELPDWVPDLSCELGGSVKDVSWGLWGPSKKHGAGAIECQHEPIIVNDYFDISAHCRSLLCALLAAKEQRP